MAGNNEINIKCDINDLAIVKNLEKNLLNELKETYERDKCVSDDLLESFYYLYKNPFMEALNQIDKHEQQLLSNQQKITLDQLNANQNNNVEESSLVCQLKGKNTSRCIYRVKGSTNINYYLFDNINFCTCQSYKYQTLQNFDNLHCKHIIIIKLYKAMDKVLVKIIDDNELVHLIKLIQYLFLLNL
jgi:hypothetical protein